MIAPMLSRDAWYMSGYIGMKQSNAIIVSCNTLVVYSMLHVKKLPTYHGFLDKNKKPKMGYETIGLLFKTIW